MIFEIESSNFEDIGGVNQSVDKYVKILKLYQKKIKTTTLKFD